jgi:NAD(P)-dependent dehydrogenase (short-subunit alcohol dehydrogenase family)
VHDGIRVNVVAPGTIHSRYVTGAVLAMDGGWTAS